MHCRRYLLVVAALLFSSLLAAGAAAADAAKLNVLLICVDDLKPILGCYGDRAVKTPNIDRLAARGLLFESAYCNQAVCSPSRNALLVGLRPQTLGIYDLATNFRKGAPDAVTLPQQFLAAGYRTESLGKIYHNGHGNGGDPRSWSVPAWTGDGASYVRPENNVQARIKEDPALAKVENLRGAAVEIGDVEDDAYQDGTTAAEAVRRLQAAAQKPDEPFFLGVGFIKPHLPFCAPRKYWELYQESQFEPAARQTPPDGAPSYAPQFGGELRRYGGIPEHGTLEPALQRKLIHGYHAAVSYMDAQVGRVLAALDASGLAERTIIVFWGDHGWHLGDHGMWCKHTNYEQAARIPLMVVAPGVTKPGTRTSSLVETVDVYPTLCELAGLSPQTPLDGLSFAAVLRDPASSTRTAATHVYPRSDRIGRAVRTDCYRLVEWKVPGAAADTAELELYDYQTDAAETKNIAAEQPEVVAQLRAVLAKQPEAKPQIKPGKAANTAAKASKPAAEGKPKQDRAAMFAKRDKDGDGRLTREEFLTGQPDPDEAPARFLMFDLDKSGTLSREEFVSSGKRK
ncbi:MAG: iduronate-2-sulfatase [Pirellula sp.]|nr:iduronate-2-sulfatase [Pirellula sp.]